MLASKSNARITISQQLGYICPECRIRLRRRLAAQRPSILAASRQSPDFTGDQHKQSAQRRYFSTNGELRSLEQVTHHTDLPLPSGTSSAPKPNAKGIGLGNSIIRDHLRAWSIQNEKDKLKRAEAGFQGPGRLTALPDSLFIEETRFDDDHRDLDPELSQYEDELEGAAIYNFNVGDLLYLEPRNVRFRAQLAVFLGISGSQAQFFLADGRWLVEKPSNLTSPILPQFASAEEVQPIQKHLPIKPVERKVENLDIKASEPFADDVPYVDAAPLVQRLADFTEEMLSFRREHIQLLDSLYERIADDEHYTSLSFDGLLAKLLGAGESKEISQAARMMVYLSVKKEPAFIQPVGARIIDSGKFIITPKRLAATFTQVCGWARQYQESAAQAAQGKDVTKILERNPLLAFIDKARRLILKSRALRSPTTTGSLGPSSVQSIVDSKVATMPTGETFSEHDKMFLEFLWDTYIRQPDSKIRTRHHSIGSLILRAIGAYPKLRLERKIGSLLLQELGVLSPWAETIDQNVTLQIPGRRGCHELDALCRESDKLCEEIGLNEAPNDRLLHDSMASLRQDFGEIPAFCVDKTSTAVRDDAYSLEPNDDVPGTYWIHVHISHPSAFFDPEHAFSKRARALCQSLYHVNFTHPMFPWGLAEALSIKDNGPALTISTLLTEDGDVKDIKIWPTRLQNVVVLEPEGVDVTLGAPLEEKAYLIVGNDEGHIVPSGIEVSAEAIEKAQRHRPVLEKLYSLLLARNEARRRDVPEYANWWIGQPSCQSLVSYVEDYDPDRLFQSYHYYGDPAIKCFADRFPKHTRLAESTDEYSLTNMAMNLAGESAAKWLGDRNIPAIFSGALTHPGFPISKLNSMGRYDPKFLPLSTFSSSPVPNVFLCATAYSRISSPLRRFSDLLSHWQVDAYLRAEAAGLVTQKADASTIELPFTKEMVDEYISVDTARLRETPRVISKVPPKDWSMRALFRAFHFKEAELPEKWDLRVSTTSMKMTTPDDSRLRGFLLPFGFFAKVLTSKEGWETDSWLGAYLPVKIELVDLDTMCVSCCAIGPPRNTFNFTDPIRIAPRPVKPSQKN
ncbi:uncharacterized protein Z518_02709 [Rhinocladiella mackenziei CBS 650.93]|uniref:RNB domain-containing protein n=1 Tax=Rhinocladiella mackenziei CBS 650.93 TaxID=1442369 RepID=A0A0D2IQ93_9EURO|nr:uncharacterized protein Z518_02709 [Rhinocladiella mackenziei CBS 650.93]KIX08054.1 hypothetical protein Z518_02709 [Rhinocladiella mackenziei CBS 650.93]